MHRERAALYVRLTPPPPRPSLALQKVTHIFPEDKDDPLAARIHAAANAHLQSFLDQVARGRACLKEVLSRSMHSQRVVLKEPILIYSPIHALEFLACLCLSVVLIGGKFTSPLEASFTAASSWCVCPRAPYAGATAA